MTAITDIWFRSAGTVSQAADALGLTAVVQDAEDTWEWVTGELRGVRLDITRNHTLGRSDTDIRVFRLDSGEFGPDLRELVIARLRPLAMGPIKCGRWLYRTGNDYDLIVVEESA